MLEAEGGKVEYTAGSVRCCSCRDSICSFVRCAAVHYRRLSRAYRTALTSTLSMRGRQMVSLLAEECLRRKQNISYGEYCRLYNALQRYIDQALQEVYVTAEYDKKGNKGLIACSYPKIAEDVSPGCQILCADGSLVLEVQECLPAKKCVRCKAINTATIGCAALLRWLLVLWLVA